MKIQTTSPCELLLTEVYSGLLLETDDGNRISVCMRDDTFEINIIPAGGDHCNWWRVNMQTGRIEKMGGFKDNLRELTCSLERILDKLEKMPLAFTTRPKKPDRGVTDVPG